ncbi:chitin-binding protein [Paenibacillus rhizovicinus]|uniref:Chitin-binding protein n=1 Tax=Paenibacillus rhizovicinus TaxID=2704463 RepID=A0A6C0NZX3_9BACL|nr:lytic polysaccharide monooxygenase [Paenibacillus rhizovicinus]QHW31203.1 chitin-binding protein [Paenibacillus rhizovicinus]
MHGLRLSRPAPAKTALICFLVVFASVGMLFQAGRASAHGYVDGPASRSALCKSGVNQNCGSIIYEPQSLEAPKGFPAAGPADGQIASAGGKFPELDQQSASRWSKVNMSSGTNAFTWTFTANHSTTGWKYYITKQNWDPNSPLSRASFDLTPFCSINYNGAQPTTGHTDTCNVPARSGYQVILAVWEIADTANAFYNVIDANFSGTNPTDATAPTAPASLTASTVAATSASLTWGAATDNIGVTGYNVYNGSKLVATVTGTSYTVTGLTASTAYTFTVKAIDAAGNESGASNSLKFTTTAPPVVDTAAPTAPTGLHIMGTPTDSSMMLMWTASTDNVGVKDYQIYNGSTLVTTASAAATSYTVTGLAASKTYSFTVYAIDAAGNKSAGSTISGTTAAASAIAAWATNTYYARGTFVTYNGHTYKCLQAHTSIYTWTPTAAVSLWELQK